MFSIGLVEMLAWAFDWSTVLRVRSSYTPIAFNTALALAVTGAAVTGAARGRARWVRAAGAFDLALGAAALAETWFRWDLGINVVPSDAAPGRMAANTALSLLLVGGSLLVWRPAHRGRWAVTGAASAVGSIAVVALLGYVAAIAPASRWFHEVAMSVPTAVGLFVLANAMMALVRGQHARPGEGRGVWLAVPAGLSAFCVIALTWIALVDLKDRQSTISVDRASYAALLVALMSAVSLGVAIAMGQRARRRQRLAETLSADLRVEVTRRQEAEQAARDGEELIFRFLDALPVGVFIATPGGRPYFVNEAATRLLGRGAVTDVDGDRLAEVYQAFLAGTDSPYPAERLPVTRALAGQAAYVDDLELRRPDRTAPVEVWGSPVFDAGSGVAYGLAVFVDITDRRAAEAREVEQAALLDLARDAIMVRDADHRLVYWNRGAEQTFGWGRGEALGRVSYDLLHTRFPNPIEEIEAALARDGHWDGELTQTTSDGRTLTMASRWVARYDAGGAVSAVMAINTDVSERKATERKLSLQAAELRRLNTDLRRSNEELQQFAYVASHDLSEPLRAISGPVSLLARRYRGALDADADQLITFATDGCERMQALIDDILDYSRAGRIAGAPVLVDLGAVLQRALVTLGPAVESSGAAVTNGPPPVVHGDPAQLGQVVQNLISNALKFSVAGRAPHVEVAAERADGFWEVSVTDDGIGIAPHHRERVFGMFKRLHGRDAYPGTGIGLALCKKIVERHGGTIGVDSGPAGSGSRFHFTLPANEETAS